MASLNLCSKIILDQIRVPLNARYTTHTAYCTWIRRINENGWKHPADTPIGGHILDGRQCTWLKFFPVVQRTWRSIFNMSCFAHCPWHQMMPWFIQTSSVWMCESCRSSTLLTRTPVTVIFGELSHEKVATQSQFTSDDKRHCLSDVDDASHLCWSPLGAMYQW